MRVDLVSYTPDPEYVLAKAAAECYCKSPSIDRVKKIIKAGHHSVLEHVSFTFHIEGISRACSHQLVRHRLASYTQRSQRYVNEERFMYVDPDSIMENPEANEIFVDIMNKINDAYTKLIALGIPKEDARYVLPNACTTSLTVTMNLRELLHFWKLRMDKSAQWEIRQLAVAMYLAVMRHFPNLEEALQEVVEG